MTEETNYKTATQVEQRQEGEEPETKTTHLSVCHTKHADLVTLVSYRD